MTFPAKESSRDEGRPVALFRFVFGTGPNDHYLYTNAETPIVHEGLTYVPQPISRGDVTISPSQDKAALEVRMAIDAPLVVNHGLDYSSTLVNLILREGHVGDADFRITWVGKVRGITLDGEQALIDCIPASSILRRKGLRRNWQYRCSLVLYGQDCKANRAAVTSTHGVTAVAGPYITLPSGWNVHAPKIKYRGGIITWTRPNGLLETRSIHDVNEATNELFVNAPTTGLLIGAIVTIVPGCNHQQDDCLEIFDNIPNHGGDSWIPLKNPFGITNNFN